VWSFFWELVVRAWERFVLAVGTTSLGFIVGLVVLPLVLHLVKVWRGKAAMKPGDFVDTAIGVLAVYGVIFLSMLIFGVPREIREQARAVRPPTYPAPFPRFHWDDKTPPKPSGPPEPKLSWSILNRPQPANTKHPRTYVNFWLDRSLDHPKFRVLCDRPCIPVEVGPMPGSVGPVYFFKDVKIPKAAIFSFMTPNPFPAGMSEFLGVESPDDEPVHIRNVKPFEFTEKQKQEMKRQSEGW